MPFYFENVVYFVPSTETKKINGFAPIHPRLINAWFSNSIFIIFQNPPYYRAKLVTRLKYTPLLVKGPKLPKWGDLKRTPCISNFFIKIHIYVLAKCSIFWFKILEVSTRNTITSNHYQFDLKCSKIRQNIIDFDRNHRYFHRNLWNPRFKLKIKQSLKR